MLQLRLGPQQNAKLFLREPLVPGHYPYGALHVKLAARPRYNGGVVDNLIRDVMNGCQTPLTSAIREEARRLGFFKVGIAQVRPLPDPQRFDSWRADGMHGEMAYMSRRAAMRKAPALLLEDARSMVVLSINYFHGAGLAADALKGRISRYAWGEDYHRIVEGRLEELLAFIRSRAPAAHGLCFVDAGPVMEKVWGAQTRLGWMGKHSNLITRELGSWFFLGVILLDLELEYDAAHGNYCGACTRCIQVCPTGAIVAPYVVDARLCISYLTIELRGAIPRQLRPLIGNRIFGCDDCQEVCPWNRFARSTSEEAFRPADGNHMPELTALAALTPAGFEQRFRNSAIWRARRDGFVRNVVVALGNSHSPSAIPALDGALHDASALVRAHAAWALEQIAHAGARAALQKAAAQETDPAVIEEIALAMECSPGGR